MIIETARLRLRPFVPEDLDVYAALLADAEVMRYVADGTTRTRAQAEQSLRRMTAGYDGIHGMHAVELKGGDAVVGEAGLLHWEIAGTPETEIAYTLARPFWGRGIATEAASVLRDHGLGTLGLRRLISLIYPDNHASIRVAEKVGMRYEREVPFLRHTLWLYALAV